MEKKHYSSHLSAYFLLPLQGVGALGRDGNKQLSWVCNEHLGSANVMAVLLPPLEGSCWPCKAMHTRLMAPELGCVEDGCGGCSLQAGQRRLRRAMDHAPRSALRASVSCSDLAALQEASLVGLLDTRRDRRASTHYFSLLKRLSAEEGSSSKCAC